LLEFLIQRTDEEWFSIPDDRFEEIVRPHSTASRPVLNRDVYTIEAAGCELSFSFEEAGIQVVFESGAITEEAAGKLVLEIANNITMVTSQKSAVVQIAR